MKNEFDEHILRKSEEFRTQESIRDLMDYFYFKVFELFNNKWSEAKVGIMEFNQFLDRVYEQDFYQNYGKYVQEHLALKFAYKKHD